MAGYWRLKFSCLQRGPLGVYEPRASAGPRYQPDARARESPGGLGYHCRDAAGASAASQWRSSKRNAQAETRRRGDAEGDGKILHKEDRRDRREEKFKNIIFIFENIY